MAKTGWDATADEVLDDFEKAYAAVARRQPMRGFAEPVPKLVQAQLALLVMERMK